MLTVKERGGGGDGRSDTGEIESGKREAESKHETKSVAVNLRGVIPRLPRDGRGKIVAESSRRGKKSGGKK